MKSLSKGLTTLLRGLRSIETLETLLLLADDPTRWWSVEQVGSEIRAQRVETCLENLARLNLLEFRLRSKLAYRFATPSADIDEVVRELRSEWLNRPALVLDVLRPPRPRRPSH